MDGSIKVLACGTNDSKMGSVNLIARPRGKSRLAEIYAALYGRQMMMIPRPSIASILAVKVRLAGRGYGRLNNFPIPLKFTPQSESAIASFHEWVMFGPTPNPGMDDFEQVFRSRTNDRTGHTNWPGDKGNEAWLKFLRAREPVFPGRSVQ